MLRTYRNNFNSVDHLVAILCNLKADVDVCVDCVRDGNKYVSDTEMIAILKNLRRVRNANIYVAIGESWSNLISKEGNTIGAYVGHELKKKIEQYGLNLKGKYSPDEIDKFKLIEILSR